MIAAGLGRRAGGKAVGDGMGGRERARAATYNGFRPLFLVATALVVLGPAALVLAGDTPLPSRESAGPAPVLVIDISRPELLLDRLTDPRVQQGLQLLPAYRHFIEGPQSKQLKMVASLIAGQLHTTWDQGLRDLTGGGIKAMLSIEPGKGPVVELVIIPKDASLLERATETFEKMARQDAASKKAPDPVRTSNYKGTVIHVLGKGDQSLAYAILSGRMVVSNQAPALERLVDRLKAMPATSPSAKPVKDEAAGAPVLLRARLDLERLRQIDPKKFTIPEKPDPGVVFLFGSWYQAIRQGRSLEATVRWSATELAADLEVRLPEGARPPSVKGFLPEKGQGTIPPLEPPGTIASLSLWRDWATIWESKADLFKPETVQGFAQLDTVAGQFFGAREFGADVLGSFDPHWRLVVAQQDYKAMNPVPDVRLPAFAIVAELNGNTDDFASRLRIAFQSIIAISNVDSAQKKGPVFELGSDEVEGVRISTTRYLVSRRPEATDEPVATRYNFSPSIAQVGRYFIFSSSTGLARSLVKELKAATASTKDIGQTPATLLIEADGPELVRLFGLNRERLVMQSMLGRGETKPDAEARADRNIALLRYLGHGRLMIEDRADRTRLQLKLDLSH